MSKFNLIRLRLLQPLASLLNTLSRPRGGTALANILAATFENGRETLQVDPSVTLPVASKWLLYERGSSIYYAKLADGGAGAASMPLGPSPDSPYQLGDLLTVDRLGANVGTLFGWSAAAITVDHLVVSSGNGLISDATTVANGTYWVVGRATATVAAANMQISYVPCLPYLLTVTGGMFTLPANPL